jgi:hypothetical protein
VSQPAEVSGKCRRGTQEYMRYAGYSSS